jgi:polysaccharide export outer membrane protein
VYETNRSRWYAALGLILGASLLGSGCQSCSTCHPFHAQTCPADIPRETVQVTQPPYVVAPPDILLIDTLRVVPLPPYKIEPLDVLYITSDKAVTDQPIGGLYSVEPDGKVTLGFSYPSVAVVGLTIDEAKKAVKTALLEVFKEPPNVSVSLAQSRAQQQVRGDHLVRPDGTIGLGTYGSVYVAGLTLAQAKAAIEQYLGQYLLKPEVSVDVFAYNSKVFYVITDGGGYGEQVIPLPSTGNETVLDAIGRIGGLPIVASKRHIWVARPAPPGNCKPQVFEVDWKGITQCANTSTNYQLFPGDRVYVMADPRVTLDTNLARIFAPLERIFGITLLGSSVFRDLGWTSQRTGLQNSIP